jgi:PTS system mannose-specific IIA component
MTEPVPGLLVVTHGRLAEEIVAAVRTIIGGSEGMEAFSLDWDDEPADAQRRIEETVRRLDRGAGVLVLTDMFGGTPTNLALSLLETSRVEVVTGVNLPMVVKFTNLRGSASLRDIAQKIAEQGRLAIHVASDLLEKPAGPSGR